MAHLPYENTKHDNGPTDKSWINLRATDLNGLYNLVITIKKIFKWCAFCGHLSLIKLCRDITNVRISDWSYVANVPILSLWTWVWYQQEFAIPIWAFTTHITNRWICNTRQIWKSDHISFKSLALLIKTMNFILPIGSTGSHLLAV